MAIAPFVRATDDGHGNGWIAIAEVQDASGSGGEIRADYFDSGGVILPNSPSRIVLGWQRVMFQGIPAQAPYDFRGSIVAGAGRPVGIYGYRSSPQVGDYSAAYNMVPQSAGGSLSSATLVQGYPWLALPVVAAGGQAALPPDPTGPHSPQPIPR